MIDTVRLEKATSLEPTIVFEGQFADKAREVLPWLVKNAEHQKTVTYGEVGKRIGLDPYTQVKHVLKSIGDALKKAEPAIPKIQLIVVTQKDRIVGNQGLGWLVPKEQIPKLTQEQKRLLCQGAQKAVFDYSGWEEILKRAGLKPVCLGPTLDTVFEEAAASSYGGGEGEDHRMLKEYVRANPSSVGLAQLFTSSSTEHPLLSGDQMDVFFKSPTEWVCIEVKGTTSPDSDIRRGVFQCVKYRAVLEAQRIYISDGAKPVISVHLVLSSGLSEELEQLAEFLKVPVKSNIRVPQNFVPPDKQSNTAVAVSQSSPGLPTYNQA